MWKEGVVFVPFGYNLCSVSAGAHRSALGLEVLQDCSKLLWERMFTLGGVWQVQDTNQSYSTGFFPDICAGHKQLKPACIPPVGPYPTPPHPTATPRCHGCVETRWHPPLWLPLEQKCHWGHFCKVINGLKQKPAAFQPRITLQEKGDVTQRSDQSKQWSKRCLKHPSPSKPIPATEWKGRGITVLVIPQIPSPSEEWILPSNQGFHQRAPLRMLRDTPP